MQNLLTNRLLASLPVKDLSFLQKHAVSVALPLKQVLYEADEPMKHAYFMTSGVASIVTTMPEGESAEVGMIGREGFVGSLHLLGPARVSTHCVMQLSGSAMQIEMQVVRDAFRDSVDLRERILEFVQEQALGLSQIAACHRLHNAEERLARWLLTAQDRVGEDPLDFTQEFRAEMLGARRATVTLVAGSLQRSQLIEYRRGHVRIVDRPSLEAATCECYKVVRRLYDGLYKQAAMS